MDDFILRPAYRVHRIRYAVRDVLLEAEKARAAGRRLIYLNIGDPNQFDFDTPPHVLEAIERALRARKNGYAPSVGYPESLEAVREWAAAKGIRAVRDVFIGHGASEPIELALTALVNPGENVLVPAPGYPLYNAVLAKLEAEENPYYLDEDNGWQPDPEDVAARVNARTRALVLVNPNNPTGSVCSRETLEGLLAVAARPRLAVLVDEIYDRMVYDGTAMVSAAALREDVPCITFGGLAKVFLGPGLRIGWGVVSGPARTVRPWIEAIHQLCRARLCASGPVQLALPAALRGPTDYLREVMARLTRRRDLTVKLLGGVPGLRVVPPRGAFYAFVRIETPGVDDRVWVRELIHRTGVVVVHGSGFGQRPGTAHFRVVFLPPEAVLREAYAAIGDFVGEYRP